MNYLGKILEKACNNHYQGTTEKFTIFLPPINPIGISCKV